MPVDASGLPTTPTDPKEIGRRLSRLERLVEMGGASRSLTSASVGRGGIRVAEGGSIVVDTGGDLEIVTGDLILGEGKIEGSALKDQLEPDTYYNAETNFALTTSWAAKSSITITRPDWATSTIIQASALARARQNGSSNANDLNADLRVSIGSSAGLATTMPLTGYSGNASVTGSTTHAAETTDASVQVTADIKSRASGVYNRHSNNRCELSVIAIFRR